MSGNGDSTVTKAPGRYTFDETATPGLLSIVWREDGQPGHVMTTIHAGRVLALARAASAWLASRPDAAEMPAPVPGQRIRTGGPRGGALSVANDEPEGTTK